jgi:hypothetical protein
MDPDDAGRAAAPAPVRTYDQLLSRIRELPPPAVGRKRVYRGQPRHYGVMLPSGRRRTVPRAAIWSHHLRRLLMRLEASAVREDIEQEFQIWLIWLQALAQHYGAGSNYLDVTHDVGIALWFAFHDARTAENETVIGAASSDRDDYRVRTTWVRLVRQPGPGQFYALDLMPWDGKGTPDPGTLVDLQDAPDVIDTSKRIQVQSGCLVYAAEGMDLMSYVVPGTPIEVAGGFEESPYASWTVEQIFPPPQEDVWYRRFLGLPFLYGPDSRRGDACFQQSLPITLYLSAPQSPYVSALKSHFRQLLPPLVHRQLASASLAPGEQWWQRERPDDATPIVLEGPQVTAHPPVEHPSWNHELLLSDWPDQAPTYAIGAPSPSGIARTDNVLIAFSPLEDFRWYEETRAGHLLRALWILKGPEEQLAVFPVLQDYPAPRLEVLGPLLVGLGSHSRRLEWVIGGDDSPGQDIATLALFAKPIVSSLVLLRDLGSTPKAAAYPTLDTGTEGGEHRYLLVVSAAAARLVRAGGEGGRPWFLLRHPSGEPYTTAEPNLGTLTVASRLPFGRIDAAEIRRALASGVGVGGGDDAPGGRSSSDSARAARG